MCSIIGSFSREKLKELAKLNEYRGQYSHSLYVFDDNKQAVYKHKQKGALDIDAHVLPKGYMIAHQQAPTYENKNKDNIHPSEIENTYLWHNGIVKSSNIGYLKSLLNICESWDTRLIHLIFKAGLPLDEIDGTFACVGVISNKMYFFTNEICPLFINSKGDISSTKFEDSKRLEPNIIHEVNYNSINRSIELTMKSKFKTKENPYFFI